MTDTDDASTLPLAPRPAVTPDRIGGRYELIERIGKGGMGVVHRARDTQLDRDVALKMLLTDVADVEETRERFVREARAAAELRHRNIIQVYDFGEENGRAFFVMELLSGDSLAAALKGGNPLPLPRALEIMIAMCDGLAFAHSKSIVHRDLKPANLFLTEDGTLKILDFGLARIASSKLTRSGLIFGTPDYMSPEQVRGKVADHRSDIFSAGAVFYQLVTGRKPFAAGSLPLVMRKVVEEDPEPLTNVVPGLARVIDKALAKDPADRYRSVDSMLAELREVDPEEEPATVVSTPVRKLGRYEVREQVGRGGMGAVYRAYDPILDRDVAIKSIRGDFESERAADQFEREARAAARLQHPNIITIYELGEAEGSPYIVMEFLGGTDLEALMRREPSLSLLDQVRLMVQLCAGLAFAHSQGVVHRDIKPSNVRVLDDGTIKLLDFGIAKLSRTDPTFSDLAGSVEYMSPEQLGGEAVDARCDVFAVGALMFELFAGRRPFDGDTPAAIAYQILNAEPPALSSLAPDLPAELAEVITRALRKDPSARFENGEALLAALRAIGERLARQPARTTRPTSAPGRSLVGDLEIGRPAPIGGAGGGVDVTIGGPTGDRPSVGASAVASRLPLKLVLQVAALIALVGATGFGLYLVVGYMTIAYPVVPGVTLPRSSGPDPVLALEVDSEPQGARVLFDGQDALLLDEETAEVQTPATVPFRGAFPSTLRLTRSGYQPIEVPVPEAIGDTVYVSTPLGQAQAYGRVVLSGPYPFEVWLGNTRLREAATDHDVRLQAGSIRLRLRNAELFLDQRLSVRVAENQAQEVPVQAPGSLTVFSRPGNCEILIDGQSVGFPPIQGRSVAAGSHEVARRCPDAGQNLTQEVSVATGQQQRVTFAPR